MIFSGGVVVLGMLTAGCFSNIITTEELPTMEAQTTEDSRLLVLL